MYAIDTVRHMRTVRYIRTVRCIRIVRYIRKPGPVRCTRIVLCYSPRTHYYGLYATNVLYALYAIAPELIRSVRT